MSFFKKLADKFDDLDLGGKRDEQQHQPPQASRGYDGFGGHSGYPGGSGPPPPQSYQQAAPRARNTGINTHLPYLLVSLVANHTLPLSSGRAIVWWRTPGPVYSPPRDKPPIPQGWIPQFDQQHQRWYYVEEASGRSQWEAPGFNSGGGSDTRGHDPSYGGGGGGPGYGAPPPQQYGGYPGSSPYPQQQEKQKSGSSGMLLGAAGGIAAGAVGGALLANALDDSDDEHKQQAYAQQQSYGGDPYSHAPPMAPRQLTRMITPRSQKRVRNIRKP
ncbi:uncharacterized protein PG998_003760 [Apiospora kogelbergensis]|uniref:uncharacterized protein n=1 Tax=Apiospora kogelbergensis TaxID=1337665 RepID=UPI00312FB6E1